MAWSFDTGAAMRRAAVIGASFVFAAVLSLGTFADPASAQRHEVRGDKGRGHGRGHDKHPNWSGGYYRAPPVIYGTPYPPRYDRGPQYEQPRYRPPPVVYGPGMNFNLQIR